MKLNDRSLPGPPDASVSREAIPEKISFIPSGRARESTSFWTNEMNTKIKVESVEYAIIIYLRPQVSLWAEVGVEMKNIVE